MTDTEETILRSALHSELTGVVVTTIRGAIDLCEREARISVVSQPGAVACAVRLRRVLEEYESRQKVQA